MVISEVVRRRVPARLLDTLPRGDALSAEQWNARHRGITWLVWFHVGALIAVGLLRGETLVHSLLESSIVAAFALGASIPRLSLRVRVSLATLGLLASSAILVHFFDGLIEMHFHFFVTIAVVALYQAWGPYLLALGFVMFHHGVIGMLAPAGIYNHHAAVANPGLFALVHGGFILAESIACLFYWKATENALDGERHTRAELRTALDDLDDAQRLSGIGSWDLDVTTHAVKWSDQLHAMAGTDPRAFQPTVEAFFALVHPEDRTRVSDLIDAAIRGRTPLDYEFRLFTPDGSLRHVHALGAWDVSEEASTRLFGTCQDVTERRRLQAEIEHLAFHDQLTGLPNRRLFLERLERALLFAARSGRPCAVLFMDLDGFKVVNDTFGHQMGDELLREVAQRLINACRAVDSISRFGGDEFAMLCSDVDEQGAALVASRVRDELHRPMVLQSTKIVFRGSIGIALSADGLSAEDILRDADAAMYAAKSSGKDSYRVFPPVPALT